jgi:hypothetical protein
MRKDERYIAVKRMIQAGDITMLDQCFRIIPKTVVAEDLGEHKGRFSTRLNGIETITYRDINNLSGLFDIEISILFKLIVSQALANEENKGSVSNRKKQIPNKKV